MRHDYPGNVRELENIIKRLIVLGNATLAKTSPAPSLAAPRQNDTPTDAPQSPAVFLKDIARKAARRAEQEQILRTLEQTRWNRGKAAKLLNISYRSLLYKMKDAGLSRSAPIIGLGV
jgi:two-component system response regulator AtoC